MGYIPQFTPHSLHILCVGNTGTVTKYGFTFLKKNKGIVKKENCANSFQYRLNFSKKNLKANYCQENIFFQPKLTRKDEKR